MLLLGFLPSNPQEVGSSRAVPEGQQLLDNGEDSWIVPLLQVQEMSDRRHGLG